MMSAQIIRPEVEGFFDPATNTISYLVKDPASVSYTHLTLPTKRIV